MNVNEMSKAIESGVREYYHGRLEEDVVAALKTLAAIKSEAEDYDGHAERFVADVITLLRGVEL